MSHSTTRAAARGMARAFRLEPEYERVVRSARVARELARDRRWHATLGRLLRTGSQLSTAHRWGRPDDDAAHVVVCLWNRPQRVDKVIEMLSAQDWEPGVRLLLWNNNPGDRHLYDDAARRVVRGSLLSVDLYHSAVNIGGLARFVAARLARNGGYRGPVIMLDDDQDVTDTFVADLMRDYSPHSVVAWWAFSLHGSYWRRAEIPPGATADHAGTGGTVYDSELVDDDRFFMCLPRRFAFLEDQWMTFVARQAGWRVVKGRTEIGLVLEETNQYHGLKPLKDVFYHFQHDLGQKALRGKRHGRRSWRRGTFTSAP
ncbi:glycosyltransferase family 2 protein [Frigoribacterium sp. 2-23]|uniref:glycosyltransferase family 2 protein n=1 Tax=Frigoribacterium sp. 2-23 TaxID=3415006 RepID=UPI003C6EBFFC